MRAAGQRALWNNTDQIRWLRTVEHQSQLTALAGNHDVALLGNVERYVTLGNTQLQALHISSTGVGMLVRHVTNLMRASSEAPRSSSSAQTFARPSKAARCSGVSSCWVDQTPLVDAALCSLRHRSVGSSRTCATNGRRRSNSHSRNKPNEHNRARTHKSLEPNTVKRQTMGVTDQPMRPRC